MSDIDHHSEFMVYAHVRPLSRVVFEVLGPPTPPLPSRTRNGSMNSHISEFWKIRYFVHELVPRMADEFPKGLAYSYIRIHGSVQGSVFLKAVQKKH